jgi:hypothetical protein
LENGVQFPTSTTKLVMVNSLTPQSPDVFHIINFYIPNATESLNNLHSIGKEKQFIQAGVRGKKKSGM